MASDFIQSLLANPPFCDVCKKKVDSFDIGGDIATLSTVFMARCHGEKEILYLPATDQIFHHISIGTAFKKKNLIEDKNEQN